MTQQLERKLKASHVHTQSLANEITGEVSERQREDRRPSYFLVIFTPKVSYNAIE
jgi:hypothetical protein